MARRVGGVVAVVVLALAVLAAVATAQPDSRPPKAQGPKPKPKPMKVKCDGRKLYPACPKGEVECPAYCPESCYADCNACKPVCVCNVPGACGDPKFIGGDGNAFYFHGKTGGDFCVVSDRDLHINAHFIGKKGHSGMARDFTWIQAIGVLFDGHSSGWTFEPSSASWTEPTASRASSARARIFFERAEPTKMAREIFGPSRASSVQLGEPARIL